MNLFSDTLISNFVKSFKKLIVENPFVLFRFAIAHDNVVALDKVPALLCPCDGLGGNENAGVGVRAIIWGGGGKTSANGKAIKKKPKINTVLKTSIYLYKTTKQTNTWPIASAAPHDGFD